MSTDTLLMNPQDCSSQLLKWYAAAIFAATTLSCSQRSAEIPKVTPPTLRLDQVVLTLSQEELRQQCPPEQSPSLNLAQQDASPLTALKLRAAATAKLRERLGVEVAAKVQLRTSEDLQLDTDLLQLDSGPTPPGSMVLLPEIAGIPVCSSDLIFYRSLRGEGFVGDPEQLSRITTTAPPQDADWVPPHTLYGTVAEEVRQFAEFSHVQEADIAAAAPETTRCVQPRQDAKENFRLEPYYEWTFSLEGTFFRGFIGQDGALSLPRSGKRFAPQRLKALGQTAGEIMEYDSATAVYRPAPATISHHLKSSYLCDGNLFSNLSMRLVQGPTLTFPPSSAFPFINQVTMFRNAQIHLDWILNNLEITSYTDAEGRLWQPVQVLLYAAYPSSSDPEKRQLSWANDKNLAKYEPGSRASGNYPALPAKVVLATGAPPKLEHLQLDPDVISHEYGHHFLYHRIDRASGEAVILHEGFSDYLVMARTGRSCIGPTICQHGPKECLSTKCLRDGANDLKLGDLGTPLYESAHYNSQILSGILWNLGEQIGRVPAANLMINGLHFLSGESGLIDGIAALLRSDVTYGSGTNICRLRDELVRRDVMADVLERLEESKDDDKTISELSQCQEQ